MTHHIAIGLRRRGHDVEIWYLYDYIAREKSPWERILYEGRPRGPASAFAIAYEFIGALIDFRPDAIVAFHPLPNILGTVAGVFGFVPARVASQHTPAACYRRWLRWLDRVLGSSFVYTRNIVVSRTLAGTFDDYPAAYRTKISVVYNSVPEPRNVLGQREARQRCSLPLDGILIGNVGRLVPRKNQKFLLELIADLPQVHLAIAGAGELRDELVEVARRLRVTDRLHLAGPLPWKGVHSFLSSLDLFIFPSQFEGFGIALVEALQVGRHQSSVSFVQSNALVSFFRDRNGSRLVMSIRRNTFALSRLPSDRRRNYHARQARPVTVITSDAVRPVVIGSGADAGGGRQGSRKAGDRIGGDGSGDDGGYFP